MNRPVRLICACLLAAALAACAPIVRNHGYVPPEDQLRQLAVGRDSRAEVAELVGRPTTEGVLGEDAWYYVQSRFRQSGYRAPQEVDREVVAISFAADGRIENIERFGLERGRVVPLSRRVTEQNVKGVGFLRQLFGNIGQFNPGDFFSE